MRDYRKDHSVANKDTGGERVLEVRPYRARKSGLICPSTLIIAPLHVQPRERFKTFLENKLKLNHESKVVTKSHCELNDDNDGDNDDGHNNDDDDDNNDDEDDDNDDDEGDDILSR